MWLALYFYNAMKGKVAFLHPEVSAEVASEHRHQRSLHPEELSVEQHLPPERGCCHLLTASLSERKRPFAYEIFFSPSPASSFFIWVCRRAFCHKPRRTFPADCFPPSRLQRLQILARYFCLAPL